MKIRWELVSDADGYQASEIAAARFKLAEQKLEIALSFYYAMPGDTESPDPVATKGFDVQLTAADMQSILNVVMLRAAEQGRVPGDSIIKVIL